jgi:hypothetical protein
MDHKRNPAFLPCVFTLSFPEMGDALRRIRHFVHVEALQVQRKLLIVLAIKLITLYTSCIVTKPTGSPLIQLHASVSKSKLIAWHFVDFLLPDEVVRGARWKVFLLSYTAQGQEILYAGSRPMASRGKEIRFYLVFSALQEQY